MKPYVTVDDAIGDLEPLEAGQTSDSDGMHSAPNHQDSTVDKIRDTTQGQSPPDYPYESDRRLVADSTAFTLISRPSSYRNTHPTQNRGITIRERTRLQTIPDEWEFAVSKTEIKKQIGNSVPPRLSKSIAQVMR